MNNRWLLGLLALALACDPPKDEVKPVVEEGLFINEIYASGEDWIEIYNSLSATKDVSGFTISDNTTTKYTLPSGTTIPAKGFLVVICNDLATGLNTNFKLDAAGETVYLENASGTLIDRVEFPALDNGQSYGRYPDGSTQLALSGTVTKGQTNGDSQAPAITSHTRTPLVPSLNQSVTISITLATTTGVASVKMYHRFNGTAYTSVTMTASGTTYSATIPALTTTGKVEYYMEATGTNGKVAYEPATAPSKTKEYLLNTDALPQLVINEFMAFNSSCCPDNSTGAAEYDDWIEIYNKGTVAVNIAGMYLSDDKNDPFKHQIPSNAPTTTTIQPGGFLVLWADNSSSQGPLHLNFGLSNAGEDVGLFYVDGRTIDVYTFGGQTENTSFGRVTNGASTWKIFTTPTPGQSN
ncbi:MAG: lamin tail domain-containing protein [Cyclobacteriaceae bacterium]|jgi:hypothetical protein|nr:lamin tail domain-containing protein [Flammeovirgaceae bacterium]